MKHQAKTFPPQFVGLKFFNVYGPNEYFKGGMASMVFHGFNQIKECAAAFAFATSMSAKNNCTLFMLFNFVLCACGAVNIYFDGAKVRIKFDTAKQKQNIFLF